MQQVIEQDLLEHDVLGERERLKAVLLTDQGGILTKTRMRLARIAKSRGVDVYAVDDVVQETLLEAWSHLERLHSPAGFAPWIDEICRNVCRRYKHRQHMDIRRNVSLHTPLNSSYSKDGMDEHYSLLDSAASINVDPLEALNRQDEILLLERALGALPPTSRQLVEMCYLLELPHAEVAARIGISIGTLDTRLHRTRRQLRQLLNGALREDALALGMKLDEAPIEGWQQTRLWCPLCGNHRLQGYFLYFEGSSEGPNVHLRCPACSRRYGVDTVHSMGLVSLAGLHTFRPAWKRTMQGLTEGILKALGSGNHPCLYCGQPAVIEVRNIRDEEALLSLSPYPLWIHLHCLHCGRDIDANGDIPSIDQLVCWSHPYSRQFIQQHPRIRTTIETLTEHQGVPAIHVQVADVESNEHLSVLVHRHTLQVLTLPIKP